MRMSITHRVRIPLPATPCCASLRVAVQRLVVHHLRVAVQRLVVHHQSVADEVEAVTLRLERVLDDVLFLLRRELGHRVDDLAK